MPREDVRPVDRVTADLRRRIESGEWAPGEGLPSTGELADHYDVSRATAGNAIKRLVGEGKLRTVPRWGTFIPRAE